MEVLVDHEVKSDEFEVVLASLGIQEGVGGFDSEQGHLFHSPEGLVQEIVFLLAVIGVEVLLEVLI